MGKRARRRAMVKRVPFGKIVYYTTRFSFTPSWTETVDYITRMFPSYEDALIHLTDIKLGFKEEDYLWHWHTPYKLIGGYKHKGKNVVLQTVVLANPEEELERARIRREESRDRLIREQWGTSVSISEVMGSNRQPVWSSGSTTRSFRTAPVVRHKTKPVRVPKPARIEHWRTANRGIERKRFASLQQFSHSPLARAKQNCYR